MVAVVLSDFLIQRRQIVCKADGLFSVRVGRVGEQRRVVDALVVGIQPGQLGGGVGVGLGPLLLGFVDCLCGGAGILAAHSLGVLVRVGGIAAGLGVIGRDGQALPGGAAGLQRIGGHSVGSAHGHTAALGKHQVKAGHTVQSQRRTGAIESILAAGAAAAVHDGGHAQVFQRGFQRGGVYAGGGDADDGIHALGLQSSHLFAGGLGQVVGKGRFLVDQADLVVDGVGIGQREEPDAVARAGDYIVHAVGDAVAVPAGRAVEDRCTVRIPQVGGQRRAAAHVGVAAQARDAVGQVLGPEGLQVVPGSGETAEHIHAAGHAGHGGAVQAAARVHQNGIRRAGFQRGHIGQADVVVGTLARQGAGGKHRHGDVAHPHKALDALGAVGQRGSDGTLAAVGLCAHKAVLIHGGHTLVAGGPENFLPAIFLVRLVGGQVRVGILAVQMQLRLAGVVEKNRRGRFAVAAGNFTESKRPHDEINIHRLTLDTVVRARFGIAALPHIVGAGVTQFVRKAGDPEILAPGVERRITEAGAHPVQRGIDALLAGVAQLGQAVEKRFGDGGHLVREDAADALVL